MDNSTTFQAIQYNESDKALIDLYTKYGEALEQLQGKSDLDQLKDVTVPESDRKNAKQRVIGFLRKAASKAGEISEKVAVEALSSYIDKLMKGM